MASKELEILVLLREVCDPKPPVRIAEQGSMVRNRGIRRLVNPADLEALEEALCLVESHGARVTAVAVGPESAEDGLRIALAMGAGRAVRVWDHALEGADTVSEARLLARILRILDPSLLFTGVRLLDRGDAPGPALAASSLGLPYLNSVVSLQVGQGSIEALKKSDRGGRQKVALPIPCAALFEAGFRELRYPDLDAVLQALEAEVEVWGLPELGLPAWEVGEDGASLRPAGYAFPRPMPIRVSTPDANLPAFERILALLSGGIQPREGKMYFGSAEEAAEGLFQILCREGLVPGVET